MALTYYDDFSSDTSANFAGNFYITSGSGDPTLTQTVSSGRLNLSNKGNGGYNYAIFRRTTDYTINAGVDFDFSVNVNRRSSDSYELRIAFWNDTNRTKYLEAGFGDFGNATSVYTQNGTLYSGAPTNPSDPFIIRVRRIGTTYTIWVDGTQVYDSTIAELDGENLIYGVMDCLTSSGTRTALASYDEWDMVELGNQVAVSDTITLSDNLLINARGSIHPSENITLSDVISTHKIGQLPTGSADRDTLFISDGTTWHEFPNFDYSKIKKVQNSNSEFELTISDISTEQKSYFKERAEFLFFCGTLMKLKGRIETITYKDAYTVEAKGEGMECKLSDKQFIVSGDSRVQYDNTSAKDIFTEINSNILTTNSGIFSSDYGNISMRYEYANRLTALASTVDAIDYYWWISQTSSDAYDTNYLNVSPTQGATASAKTFDLTNCEFEQERDTTNLVNYVYGLGYGDGINQLSTYVYAASTQSSFLSANISATDTSIPVVNGSVFNATGSVRIAKEVITYEGVSSNTLTGCARPTDGSAKAHNKLCYIEQHYLTSSAQTGSSINTYGVKDYSLIDRTILNEETLEVVASGYMSDRKDVIQSITIKSDDPLSDMALNIGDLVTATSSESNLNGNYHIVSQEFIDNYGELSLTTEISNRSAAFISALQQTKKDEENAAKYMQGATNIYALTNIENVDSTSPFNMKFFVPTEAVAINKVLLNFKIADYRQPAEIRNDIDEFLTIPGNGFVPQNPDVNDVSLSNLQSHMDVTTGPVTFVSPVTLPQGSEIISAIVYGTGTWTWRFSGGGLNPEQGLLTLINTVNLEDTTTSTDDRFIYNDNSIFWFQAVALATGDKIYGAKITYRLPNKKITTETLSNPRIIVSAGAEDSESAVGTYTTSQSQLDITSNISSLNVGDWVNIKFDAEGGTQDVELSSLREDSNILQTGSTIRIAQKKTIKGKIKKLGFFVMKEGSPPGNVTYAIRKVSDGSVIQSKSFAASTITPTTAGGAETITEAEFDYPLTLIDEEVYLSCEYNNGDASNHVEIESMGANVRNDEVMSSYISSWAENTGSDLAYQITYDSGRARIEANAYVQLFIKSE